MHSGLRRDEIRLFDLFSNNKSALNGKLLGLHSNRGFSDEHVYIRSQILITQSSTSASVLALFP